MVEVSEFRTQFPLLNTVTPYGKPLAYLDNAASAQKPECVLQAMDHAYRTGYANVHRGLHYLANAATDGFENARKNMAKFLNAPHADTIVFTRNATEAFNLLAHSFVRPRLKAGDEIILSLMEHHANIVPWHMLREQLGITLKWLPVAADGSFDVEQLAGAITDKTKLITLTHCSNVLGTVVDVKRASEIAKAASVPIIIDGSQGAVHCAPNVAAIDCDFYIVSGHKIYGPTGIGAVYGKASHWAAMPPFMGGGEMIETVTMDSVTYNAPPMRFEAGTPAIVEAIGLGAAVEFMMAQDHTALATHEHSLMLHAQEELAKLGATLHGTAPNKAGIVAFSLPGIHAHDVATLLDRQGVAIRAGSHCAMPLLQSMGITSSCRASFLPYNTHAEVEQLISAVKKAQEMLA